MPTATLRLPVRSALIQAPPYPTHGVEILASIRLDLLADALNAMEHDDTDPGERPMNADQCRDALLRELLAGWSPSELVEAKIPAVLEMDDEIVTLRMERDEARATNARLREGVKSVQLSAEVRRLTELRDALVESMGTEGGIPMTDRLADALELCGVDAVREVAAVVKGSSTTARRSDAGGEG